MTITSPSSLRGRLDDIVLPAAESLLDHDYYQGLLDGSLPPAAVSALARQDGNHLLPAYGRALAHCAVHVHRHQHARLLAHLAQVSLDSAAGSAAGFPATARRFGLPGADEPVPRIAPATRRYIAFLRSCSAGPVTAGVGAVLPSAWLYQVVSDQLMARRDPTGRYGELIELMYPGPDFAPLVDEFLVMAAEVHDEAPEQTRGLLPRAVADAVALETAFVDAAWLAGR